MTSKTFRTTIVRDGAACFIPLTFDPKVAFGKVRAPVKVTVHGYTDLDTEKREIVPPSDFAKALKATPAAWKQWQALAYSHQREHVEAIEEAKQPETRARRITRAVAMIAG